LHLRDPAVLIRLALDPQCQFGELYSCGRLEVEGDLVTLIEAIFAAQGIRRGWRSRFLSLVHAPRSNLLGQSSANIHHHYDLGNEFFRLWLDRQLLYTCAYFAEPTAELVQAQVAKMNHVCRKLRLQPGERVVESGCGWGALALHMAREYGVQVRAYNISREQIAYARQQARAQGLEDRVAFIEADYRAMRGDYDVFVSVSMLEHVGRRHYQELGMVIDRCLGKQGRGFIHAIGTDCSGPLNPWIEQRIFPGSYPPTLGEMMDVLESAGLSVLDVENLRLHYAKTLEHRLARFEASTDRVEAMFGPNFVRAWRLYLAGSSCAWALRRAGMTVAVIDQAQFPLWCAAGFLSMDFCMRITPNLILIDGLETGGIPYRNLFARRRSEIIHPCGRAKLALPVFDSTSGQSTDKRRFALRRQRVCQFETTQRTRQTLHLIFEICRRRRGFFHQR